MDSTGVRGAGQEGDGPRVFRVAHVDNADAVRISVADIGIAAMDHDLNTVAAPTLVGVADELDVAGRYRSHGAPIPCCTVPAYTRTRDLGRSWPNKMAISLMAKGLSLAEPSCPGDPKTATLLHAWGAAPACLLRTCRRKRTPIFEEWRHARKGRGDNASRRTTQRWNHRREETTLDEAERITIQPLRSVRSDYVRAVPHCE